MHTYFGMTSVLCAMSRWLNNQHYGQLIKSNLLDDDLARRIEVRNSLYFPKSLNTN
jgi:hypothetical protein